MSLKDIGVTIDEFPVRIARSRVIEYFDGDRIVEYRSASKDPYFKIWTDTDHDLTRWFFVRLTNSDVARFLHGDLSLRQLILEARDGHIYVVDTRGSSTVRVAFLQVHKIPPKDIPLADSYYDDTLTPECELQKQAEQSILLNGDWSGGELGLFERRFTQVYAFNALFASGVTQDISGIKNKFRDITFAGAGGAHVNLLDSVVGAVPRDAKPRFESIQLSSPGVVRYNVDSATAGRVREIMRLFKQYGSDLEKAHAILDSIRMEINREANEIEDPGARYLLLSKPNDALRQAAISLAERMKLDPDRIWLVASTDVNSAELIANCYRRSCELYQAERSGRAVLV
jgi:hypothetical protein